LRTSLFVLTSSETGGLWTNFISDSMFRCVYQYCHALDLAEQHIKVISGIFLEEGKLMIFQLNMIKPHLIHLL
jgi:hypothetical protein